MANDRLVDIPAYAKLSKRGSYYAWKKDMPYYADEENIRGYNVIGYPSDVPGKMIPSWCYDTYCAPDAGARKAEEATRRKKKAEERARKEAEKKAELERNFGEEYISANELTEEVYCYPLPGFFAEHFFHETGMDAILDKVLSPERAWLIRLSAALLASYPAHLSYSFLNSFPMKPHMLFHMNSFFSTRLWSSVTEEEIHSIFAAWIRNVKPQQISSRAIQSKMTLYHDDSSDHMGGWFSSRIRTGTKYYPSLQIYRDMESHQLLAFEHLKYVHNDSYPLTKLSEIHTIENSDYPELRSASLHFFLDPYTFKSDLAVRLRKSTIWIHPSEYKNQKELGAKIKDLGQTPVRSGWRTVQWNGRWEDTEGTWILTENTGMREGAEENARHFLQNTKKRLQLMSYYPASSDYSACYFDIEKEDDESDFFDNAPFTVKAVPGATKKFRLDIGRCLCFTTEGPFTEEELIRQLWCEDDLRCQYSQYMNHGETSDVTEEFFDAMKGRELPLFLASMYREWIYHHIGDLFGDGLEITPFLRKAAEWRCTIHPGGKIEADPMEQDLEKLLKRFDVSAAAAIAFLEEAVRQPHYFSDAYSD